MDRESECGPVLPDPWQPAMTVTFPVKSIHILPPLNGPAQGDHFGDGLSSVGSLAGLCVLTGEDMVWCGFQEWHMEMLYGVQIGILYDVVFKNVTKRSGRIYYLRNHKKIQYEWYLKTTKKTILHSVIFQYGTR